MCLQPAERLSGVDPATDKSVLYSYEKPHTHAQNIICASDVILIDNSVSVVDAMLLVVFAAQRTLAS